METDLPLSKVVEHPHELSIEDVRKLLTKPTALNQIAEVVQELMDSAVCVIWKPSRTVEKLVDHPKGRLYPYSSTFAKGANVQHAGIPMDLEHDCTGRFYNSQEPCTYENDFASTDAESPSREFMAKAKLKRVCIARFGKSESLEEEYAVSVYRRADQLEFNQGDADRLRRIAWFLPTLYRRMVDSELKDAIIKVNELLRPKCLTIDKAIQQLNNLCPQLANFFHCHEVTIYLREPHSTIEEYILFATTLDKNRMTKKHTSNKGDGLTSYVLATHKTIWFHDLQNFHDSQRLELIRRRYPEIAWADGARLGQEAKQIQELADNAPNPPLPFVAAPIFGGDNDDQTNKEILGVIRASLGKNPFYFIEDEVHAFEIIAQEIGRWWDSLKRGLEQQKRSEIWEALNNTLRAQHAVLQNIDDDPDLSDKLAKETIDWVAKVPSFAMVAFRRGHDKSQLQLVTLSSNKTHNLLFSPTAIVPFGGTLGPLDHSREFHIERKVRSSTQIEKSGSNEERRLFTNTTLVLSLAVMIGKELYGVLDVGLRDELDFRFAEDRIWQFLEIAARQLALFELVRIAQENELRTYTTITHQLKSPLLTASSRLRDMITALGGPGNPEIITLAQIAGMVRKANGVTSTIEMLGRLIKKVAIPVTITSVTADIVRKLALEISLNHRLLAPEQMKSSFTLDPSATWGSSVVYWNQNCAENSLDAVIGNAFKYSDVGEVIQIIGHFEEGFFIVGIVSRGLILRPEDVEKCTDYEWRSKEAKKQEGAGIGLWITKHYMRLQGGELRVHPTNRSGETLIELLFPTRNRVSI